MDPKEVSEMVELEKDPDGTTHQVAVIMTGEIYRNAGLKNSKHSEVEGSLYDKLCKIGKHKLRDEVRLMAKNIAVQVSDKNFEASVSWLDDFSRRFCLSRKKMGFHSASMLKTKVKGAANKTSPLKVKSVTDLNKKTTENGHASNGSESNKSSKNINGKDISKEEIDTLEDPEEDPEEDPLKIISDEAMETDSVSKSDTNNSEDKPKPQIRVRTGLEQVQSKSDTENVSDEVIEVSEDEEKIEDTPDTDSSNASKKGGKGKNTSNEGESDGGTSEEQSEKDAVELTTDDKDDKEEESKDKKKDDGNDILIDYSDKETKYWKKSFEVLEKKVSEEVFRCSSCNEQVNHQIRGLVKAHPVLGVFLCKRCRKFYGKGRFCKDDEGYDEYCRWCAEGGDLLCCEQEGCFNGFCKRCIKRNLGRSEASHAENAENWSCYVCDKTPLREPRAILRTIIYCIDKAEQKADKMSRTDHKKKDMKSKFELLKRNRLNKIKENVEKNKKNKKESKDKVKKEPQTEEDSKTDLLAALSEGANRGEPWLQDSIDSMGDMIQICQLNLQKIDQKWKRESCSAEATAKAVGRILKQIKAMSTNFNIIEEHLSKSNTEQGDGVAEASTSNMDVENADDQVIAKKETEQSQIETKDQQMKIEGNDKKANEDEEEVSMKSPRKGRKTVIESDDDTDEDKDKDEDEVTETKRSPKKGRKKSDETDSSDDEIANDTKSKSKEKKNQSAKGKSDKTDNKNKNKGGGSSKSSKEEDENESKDSAEDNEIVEKKGENSSKSSKEEDQDESKDSAEDDESGKDDENVEKKRKRNSSNDTDDKTKDEDIKNKRRKSMRGKSIDDKVSEDEDKVSGKKTPNKNQKVQDNKKGKANARKGSKEQTGSDEDLFADSVTDMDAGDLAESSINGSLSNDEEQKVKVKKETDDNIKKETKYKIKKEDPEDNDDKVKSEDEESSENEKKKKKKLKKENEKSLNSLINSDSDSDNMLSKSLEKKHEKKSDLSKKKSKSPKKTDDKSPKKKSKDSKGNEKRNNESDHESEEESVDSEAEMLGLEARASDDDRDEIRKKKSKKKKDEAYTPKAPSKLRGPRSKRKDKKTLAEEDKNDDAKRAILDSDSDVTDADSEGDGESIIKNRRRKSKWTQKKQLSAKCVATIKNLSNNMKSKLNDDGFIDLFEFPELTKLKRRKGWLSPRKKGLQLPLNSDDNDSDEEFARLMKFKVPKPAPKSRKKKPEPITDDEEDKKENVDKRKHNKGGSKKKKKEGLCDIDINNDDDDDDDDQEDEEEEKKNRKSKKKTNDTCLSLNEKMKKNILMSSDEEEEEEDEELTDEEEKNLGEVLEEERRKKYEERRAKKKEEEEKRRKEREEAGEDTSEEDNKTRKKKKGYMNLNISSSEEEDNDKDDGDDDDSDDDSDDDDDSDFSESPRKRRAFEVSDSDSDFKSKKRRGKKSSSSDDDDDDESSEDDKKKSKRKRVKRMTSSEEGDEDEEEEGSPKKDGESPSKKKKIRKIIADDDLEKSTVDATQEEDARRQRIRDRQKQFNQIFEIDLEATEHELTEVVLDYDGKSKEPVVSIHEKLVKTLKPHQIKGIKFMWDATVESVAQLKKGEKGGGCILAHCMGLGKTLQIITYVHTLLVNKKINKHMSRVMVCCPVNTVYNWVAEFKNWLKGGRMCPFDVVECVSAKDLWGRAYRLDDWWKEGGVMIMGYDMFRNLSNDKNKKYKGKMKEIFQKALVNPGPDVMVCDEGHILKNEKTNLSKAINTIQTKRRIILTGTPLQNNLSEYHCMVQFVKPSLLGTLKEFRNRFVNPIEAGQSADSLPRDVRRMKRRAHILHNMLEGCVQRFDYTVLKPFLPPKFEYVLSVQVAPTQEKLYRYYLDNLAQGGPKKGGSGLFVDFGNLSRIWTHPKVLELAVNRAMLKDDLDDEMEDFICDETSESEDSDEEKKKKKKTVNKKKSKGEGDEDEIEEIDESAIAAIEKPGAIPGMTESGKVRVDWWKKVLEDAEGKDYNEEEYMNQMEHSGKLVLLLDILRECNTIGDKILVFSQSLLALDMIEEFLGLLDQGELEFPDYEGSMPPTYKYWKKERDYQRLDGSCTPEYRRNICKDFNRANNERCRLFLISTRAGGLGINLVAANRVIIFDSSWNPSHDTQSIFRVYRFGQKKPCYVYRFVAQGTMEEKIYSRQVTKESTSMRVVDEHQIKRYFNMADLQELYSFTPEAMNKRDIPDLPQDRLLAEMLKRQNKWIVKYHEHDSLLEHQAGEGLSEEERKAAWEDYENEKKGMFANQQGMGMGMGGMQMGNMNNMGGYGMPSMAQFSLEGVVNTIRAQNPALSQQEMYRSVELATKQIQKIHLGHYQRVQAMVYNLKNPMLAPEQRSQMPFANHPEMMPFLEQQLRTLEENIQRENQVIQQMAQLSRTAATPQTMMAAGLVRGQPGTSGQVSGTANYVNHSKTTPATAAASVTSASASKPSVTIKPTSTGNSKPAVTIKPTTDKKISSEVIDLE